VLVSLVFLSIFLIPVFLVKYSSVFHYEEAVESYKQGNYYAALNSLDHAILDFGDRTPEACLLISVILMEQYGQYNEAIMYAEIGIHHTDSPTEQAKLLYLKGKSLKENGAYRLAIDAFTQALKLWPGTDTNHSSMNITDARRRGKQFEPMVTSQLTREKMLYTIGEIYAFFQNDYMRAITYFNELTVAGKVIPEAFYGRGYCYYKLQKNTEAIADFNTYIQRYPTNGMAYYFRGRSNLQLGQQEAACQDFQQAQTLGSDEGKRMSARYCL
jgi:tetratricopeptide (TPR) repeat protein